MRPSPDDPQDDRSRASDDQDVSDNVHLPQPRLQVIRRSFDVQERPDETERKETERKVDEEEPLPFLREGTSNQRADGTGESPDTTDDTGEYASFGQREHVGDDWQSRKKRRWCNISLCVAGLMTDEKSGDSLISVMAMIPPPPIP